MNWGPPAPIMYPPKPTFSDIFCRRVIKCQKMLLCIIRLEEMALRSGSVLDCHATARVSIPGGNGVFTELHVLRKVQSMGVPSLNDLTVDRT